MSKEQHSHSELWFLGTWGQRFLILLAPFFLLPSHHDKRKSSYHALFQHLHMQIWAPIMGSLFFSGAITVTFRVFQKHFFNLDWLINLESTNVLFHVWLFLTVIAYSATLARVCGEQILRKIFHKTYQTNGFSFWSTRYGGTLMFSGVLAWLITGFIWLDLDWYWYSVIGVLLCLLMYFAAREYIHQNNFISENIPYTYLQKIKIVELCFFALFISISILLYWYCLTVFASTN